MTTIPLGNVADVLVGRMHSPGSDQGPNQMPYLRAANVGDGRLLLGDVKMMKFSPQEQVRYELRSGDVLLTEASGSREQVGATAAWDSSIARVMFQNTLLRLRARPGTDPRFLYWWSRHAYEHRLYARAAQGLAIWHLGSERARSLPVPLVSVESQRQIADFLDDQVARLDRAHALREKQIAGLLERRASRVLFAVTGTDWQSHRDRRLAWASSVRDDWPTAKINHVARLGSGHTPSRGQPEWWDNCVIPWITTGEVAQVRDDRLETLTETRECLSWLGIANSSAEVHPTGTVVLSRTASAGFSAVMGTAMATSQDYVTWTCGPRLRPYFLLWCLRAMRPDLLGRLAMGSTHKTIYVPDIQTLRIPLPSLADQEAAVANIRVTNAEIDRALDLLRLSNSLLAERRRSLITAAVTGQFDVAAARSAA
jgi:type I restriction enzyme S subunit